jgi:predicted amidophosphoribosyltransferase
MGYKAIKIDELTIGDHHHLSDVNRCFYLMEYTKGAGNGTRENSLIHNFKKSLEHQNTSHWHYKHEDTVSLARLFKTLYVPMLDLPIWSLVPIPPSKCKSDPLYDDRMLKLLKLSCGKSKCDIRELIIAKKSREASHASAVRPSLKELQDNLEIDVSLLSGVKKNIILFDDVITSGAHYVACKNLIIEKIPDANIYAMFIARRVL